MRVFLILGWFCVICVEASLYELAESQYEQMPPIVTLDHYHKCMREVGAQYCTGHMAFVADEPSPLLDYMKEISSFTASRYNHTRARYGKCVKKSCKDFWDERNTSPYQVGALEACLNQSVSKEYNLKVKLEDDLFCYTNDGKKVQYDRADIIVAAMVLSFVMLNVIGTLFDVYCSKKLEWPVGPFLLMFSIPRNWGILLAPSTIGKEQFFQGLYGLRFVFMVLEIVLHSLLPLALFGSNPKFAEEIYDIPPMYIFFNGNVGMQTYLIMASMLLVYNLQIYSEKHTVTGMTVLKGILKRWLRLTPAYAVVLAISATWMKYLGSGPLWQELVTSEADDCARDWWLHVLYINNYVDYSKCMPQAWYMPVDMQLYVVAIVLYMFCRSETVRTVVLSSVFAIGISFSVLHTYFQDLDGSLITSPEASSELFTNDRTFNNTYKRGHTNLTGCIIGMVAGYRLYNLLKSKFDGSKHRMLRVIYAFVMPTMLCILMALKVMYAEGPRPRLVYRVLLSAVMKPGYGIGLAVFVLGLIFKMDTFWHGLMSWGVWRAPARLSFAAYLLHVPLLRVFSGALTDTIHVTMFIIIEWCVSMLVLSYLAALVFWLTVEAPLSHIIRWALTPEHANTRRVDTEDKAQRDNPKSKKQTTGMQGIRNNKY